jgi:hypothetical protein
MTRRSFQFSLWTLLVVAFAGLLALACVRLWQAMQNGSETTVQRGWISVSIIAVCLALTLCAGKFRRPPAAQR